MRPPSVRLVLEVTTCLLAATAFLYVLLQPGGAYDQGWGLLWAAAMAAYVAYPLLLERRAAGRSGAFVAGHLAIGGVIAWITRLDFVSGLLMYGVVGRAVLLDPRLALPAGAAAVAIAYAVAGALFGARSAGIYLVLLAWTAGLAFTAAGTLLLVRERAARERSDALLRQLGEAHERLRASAARVHELATAEERNRLAREIHDSLGHYLTVVNVQLEAALALRGRDPARADRALGEAKRLAGEALAEVRRSVAALRPAALDALPLREAIERHVVQWGQQGGPDVAIEIEGDMARCGPELELLLFRAVQEGLTNVRKHARAAHAWVGLRIGQEAAELRVRDDGVGVGGPSIQPDQSESPAGGFGLVGLRERAAALGGTLTLGPAVGGGAELRLTAPLATAPVDQTQPAPGQDDRPDRVAVASGRPAAAEQP
jgi:signal transduction histidine kinase